MATVEPTGKLPNLEFKLPMVHATDSPNNSPNKKGIYVTSVINLTAGIPLKERAIKINQQQNGPPQQKVSTMKHNNKPKIFEFPQQPIDTQTSFNKTNNSIARKTFHSRSPSPSIDTETIRVPTVATNRFNKDENKELMIQTLYSKKRESVTDNYPKKVNGGGVKSSTSRNAKNSSMLSPTQTKDSKGTISPFTMQQSTASIRHNYVKKNQKNSDDLAHVMMTEQTGSFILGPFKNQALNGGKIKSPSNQGLGAFQYQMASSLYLHNPSIAVELQKKLLSHLPLTNGGAGPSALQRDETADDFMTMEQYQKVIKDTETLLMASVDPNIAAAAMEHRRSRMALLNYDDSVVNASIIGSHQNQWQSVNYSFLNSASQQDNMINPEHILNQSSIAALKVPLFARQVKKSRQKVLSMGGSNHLDIYQANPITQFAMIEPHTTKYHEGPSLIGIPSAYTQIANSTMSDSREESPQPGFMFTSPMAPLRNAKQKQSPQKLQAMKKNLKLIREDRARDKKSEKFAKIYEKLKISLEPIAEQQSVAYLNDTPEENNTSILELEDSLENRLKDLQAHHDAYLWHIASNYPPLNQHSQPSIDTLVASQPLGNHRLATMVDQSFSSNIQTISPPSYQILPPIVAVREPQRASLLSKKYKSPSNNHQELKLAKISDFNIPMEQLDIDINRLKSNPLSPNNKTQKTLKRRSLRAVVHKRQKSKISRNNQYVARINDAMPIISPKKEYSVMTHQIMNHQEEYMNFGNAAARFQEGKRAMYNHTHLY